MAETQEGFESYEGSGRWGLRAPLSTEAQLLAVIRAAHALLAAGDMDAAQQLLAAFGQPGVDALC